MILHFQRPSPPVFGAGVKASLMASSFDPESWRDVVSLIHQKFQAVICLLLLDDSDISKNLHQTISNRYVDIDRITGRDIIVVSQIKPPESWFRYKLDEYAELPPEFQDILQADADALQSDFDSYSARINARELMTRFFDEDQKFPLLCFVQPRPTTGGAFELDAKFMDFSGFRLEWQVIHAFEHLSKAAAEKKISGGDAIDLALDELRPTLHSLRFKNGAFKLLNANEFLGKMLGHAKSLCK